MEIQMQKQRALDNKGQYIETETGQKIYTRNSAHFKQVR